MGAQMQSLLAGGGGGMFAPSGSPALNLPAQPQTSTTKAVPAPGAIQSPSILGPLMQSIPGLSNMFSPTGGPAGTAGAGYQAGSGIGSKLGSMFSTAGPAAASV